ncbi:TnpV protein [Thermohalobacter berrensis]
MKRMFKRTIKNYLAELNPKLYKELMKTGEITKFIENLNSWAKEVMIDIEEKMIKENPGYHNYLKNLQHNQMIHQTAKEIVRKMLEEEIMKKEPEEVK